MKFTPEQLKARQKGIGASEAAAALGLSRYANATPLDVYLRKVAEEVMPQGEETPAQKRGHLLESAVLDFFESDEKGGKLSRLAAGKSLFSEKYPFLFATCDALTWDKGEPVEAKTVGGHMAKEWGEPGTDDVPQEYLIQVTQQMIVTKSRQSYIPVLLPGLEFQIYRVELDKELAGMLVEGLRRFWARVINREPPEPRNAADVAKLYRRSKADVIEVTAEISSAVKSLGQIREQIMPLTQAEAKLEEQIKLYMRDRDTLTESGVVRATWKTGKDESRFDAKRLKEEMPEIYQQYLLTVPGKRPLLLKD